MKSTAVDQLKALANSATQWRTAAGNVGVDLFQINVKFGDDPVVLLWDDEDACWSITAS